MGCVDVLARAMIPLILQRSAMDVRPFRLSIRAWEPHHTPMRPFQAFSGNRHRSFLREVLVEHCFLSSSLSLSVKWPFVNNLLAVSADNTADPHLPDFARRAVVFRNPEPYDGASMPQKHRRPGADPHVFVAAKRFASNVICRHKPVVFIEEHPSFGKFADAEDNIVRADNIAATLRHLFVLNDRHHFSLVMRYVVEKLRVVCHNELALS